VKPSTAVSVCHSVWLAVLHNPVPSPQASASSHEPARDSHFRAVTKLMATASATIVEAAALAINCGASGARISIRPVCQNGHINPAASNGGTGE
jgi:hypothetical protein